MNLFDRREFLQRSAILSAAAAAGTPLVAAAGQEKKGSANEKLRVAVVGVNSRGMSHVEGFGGNHNCEVAVICDCDEAAYAKAMKSKEMTGDKEKKQKGVIEKQGFAPKYEKDFRRLLDDKSIDVISIATPNHWHALMSVWAMRAGKDVYCEKPATHNVREGRLMVKSARKHNRICQVGTQSRSTQGMRDAIAYVHSGAIGKVNLAYGTCYKSRGSIGDVGRREGDQKPPKTMDYDLWTGPAAMVMPRRNSPKHGTVHYEWHWIWNYGNGDLGNQGVHEMDKARWGLNAGLPTSVVSVGGRVGYLDDGETPNTLLTAFEYPGAHLIFEVRGLKTDKYLGAGVGNIFFGDKGYVVCPSYSSGVAYAPDGTKVKEFKGGGDHFGNFIKAVRSRNIKDLNCDVEEGHLSAALCHLGNISYRLGAEVTLDKPIDAFTGCKEAVEALDRMKKHLKENAVDLATATGRAGLKLRFDAETESFAGSNPQAKDMLFREYRKGFDITEAV